KGGAGALPAIQAALAGDTALRPAKRSKAQSALAVVRRADKRAAKDGSRAAKDGSRAAKAHAREAAARGTPPAALEIGRSPGIEAIDPLAEAGRKVLRFHFARMLDREAAVR